MIALLLPLMAQVSVPMAPIQRVPNAAPPAVQMVQPPTALRVQLLPDLVVKEIRKDGTNAVRVLIANDGSADEAPSFSVIASASYRSRRGSTMPTWIGPLKAGQTQWVRFGPFHADRESWYPGKPESTLADWESISVIADSYMAAAGWGSGGIPSSLDPTPNPCTPERGCVVELDEKNNMLSAPIASMTDWTDG
jgi:hypothetical protein